MRSNSQNTDPRWYAIQTKPKQEDRADRNLRAWNVETFNPKVRQRRHSPYGGPPVYTSKPLFPRYIFAKFKVQDLLHKVRFTRGVYKIVAFGDTPTPVDDQLIAVIRSRQLDHGFVRLDRLDNEFETGSEVVVTDGPLKGFVGIFKCNLKGSDRVMILLNTIGYQARLVVFKEQIKMLKCTG